MDLILPGTNKGYINYRTKILILIGAISIFRIIVAGYLELGNDESYYWVYSQYLQWNYFDHPPMVALWTRLFSANLLLQDHLIFLRIGSIVACGIATWLIYQTTTMLGSAKAGFIAGCLYNASFYSGLTAGMLIMPDAPQMIFWTLSLWCIAKISKDPSNINNWIFFGLSTGACIMSKVHGIYLLVGMGLYILFYNRALLKNRGVYISIIIISILISPILIWNIQNEFVTYKFHSERIIIHGYLFNIENFLKEFLLESLVNNPVNFLLITIFFVISRKQTWRKSFALRTFDLIGFSLIIIVLFLSLFRDTRPIWSGPAYITLIPATAIGICMTDRNIYRKLSFAALGLFLGILVVLIFVIQRSPGTFGSTNYMSLGKGDISLDTYGWRSAGEKFDSIYESEIKKGIVKEGTPMICNNWWGAHEEYYFCRPLKISMIGLGNIMNLHEYYWTNKRRMPGVKMDTAFCVVHSDEAYDAKKIYGDYFTSMDSIATIHIKRGGIPAHNFFVLRFSGWKHDSPIVY